MIVTLITKARAKLAGFASVCGLLAACAAAPLPDSQPVYTPSGDATEPAPATQTVASLPPFETSGLPEFDAWRDDFATRAIAQGRNPVVVYDTLRDLKPLDLYLGPRVETATSRSAATEQAEFSKPIWNYIETAVSDARQTTALSEANERAALLQRIDAEFGVDAGAVLAIWGMETNFGGFIGDYDAPEVLANMAVEGRRRSLAERELLATMQILEQGLARRDQLVAGWAGAMGHTQFMPSTYLEHAVDFTGDGTADVWATETDALASAANYLKASGYRSGEPWGTEVIVPSNFDFSLADNRTERSVRAWQDLGLRPEQGTRFPADLSTRARMWTPAGARGPKYLLFNNYDVFLTYNRSNSYAYSVGLLADVVTGRPAPRTPWPTDIQRISVGETMELQAALNRLGYSAGSVDGIAGTGTRAALQKFQKDRGLLADGYPTREALSYVRSADQAGVSGAGVSR